MVTAQAAETQKPEGKSAKPPRKKKPESQAEENGKPAGRKQRSADEKSADAGDKKVAQEPQPSVTEQKPAKETSTADRNEEKPEGRLLPWDTAAPAGNDADKEISDR